MSKRQTSVTIPPPVKKKLCKRAKLMDISLSKLCAKILTQQAAQSNGG